MSERNRRRFCLAHEPEPGVQAATPSARILRVKDNPNIDISRDFFTSAELRQDRMSALGTTGSNRTKLTIPFELSFGSFDDLLEGALFGRFIHATGAQAVTLGVSVAIVAAAHTITRASGSFVDDGFAAGDFVIISGFVNAGNNGLRKITALEATIMTVADCTTLVNETLASGSVFDRWNGLPVQLGAVTVAVDASDTTFTRSEGSYVTDGVQVGDYVTFAGFAEAGNNGTFKVSAVAALVLTCATATGLADEAAKASTSYFSTRGVLKGSTVRKTFQVEQGQTDFTADKYRIMSNAIVDGFKLDIPVNGVITGSFDLLGTGGDIPTDTPLTASPAAASTSVTAPVFNSCVGSIKENNVALAIVAGFSIQLMNNAKHNFVIFSRDASNIGVGSRKITGKTTFRWIDSTYSNKYLAETVTSTILEPTDSLGNKYRITIPEMKYTAMADEGDNSDIQKGLSWEAGPNTTLATDIQIEKIPA